VISAVWGLMDQTGVVPAREAEGVAARPAERMGQNTERSEGLWTRVSPVGTMSRRGGGKLTGCVGRSDASAANPWLLAP
jgi:hypothetical protein